MGDEVYIVFIKRDDDNVALCGVDNTLSGAKARVNAMLNADIDNYWVKQMTRIGFNYYANARVDDSILEVNIVQCSVNSNTFLRRLN